MYFAQFKSNLGVGPKLIDSIPVVKSQWVPDFAMDIKESTPEGNGDVIDHMSMQAGRTDGQIEETCFIFHGHLSTMQHQESIQKTWCICATAQQRVQHAESTPGHFHALMADSDGIWWTHIEPATGRIDENTFFHYITILQPKESRRFTSCLSFHQMHDAIWHIAQAATLDCWWPQAGEPLREWITEELGWEDIMEMSKRIVHSISHCTLAMAWRKPLGERDQGLENSQILLWDCWLYVVTHHLMTHGDIGLLELLLHLWIFIWTATGKHNYAT
ncbi:hypothetical protein K439DRAFT_1617276 [Ramaria rubella]|nr:hypothetical protein K439DRAFT_1617276 [Ramaria rubella]